ncbi:MAG: hypothetical protein WBE75_07450 [Candidatus Omnitrophota bacterium]
MLKTKLILSRFFVAFLLFCLLSGHRAQAQVLESWQDSRAYKPVPVLFLHGFAKGSPADWQAVIAGLQPYFTVYQQIGHYLETLDFQDPNGSIDTYPAGKLNPQGNNRGWSDKLALKVDELLSSSKYGLYCDQLNIVAHSMGGLAARYYLATNSLAAVPKLVLVGVPNLGTPLSTAANGLSLIPQLGWSTFLGPSAYIVTLNYTGLEALFQNLLEIDFQGYAVDDMDSSALGSGFLPYLNNITQPNKTKYSVIVGKHGSLLNLILFQGWSSGDSVVHTKSQLGTDCISTQDVIYIKSVHWKEPTNIALQEDNPVLKFLDSDVPVLELTEPGQSEIEISEGTVTLKGKLFKEYLPADTKLVVNIENAESDESYPAQEFPMLPSDLWQAKQADSPVGEFNAQVLLPGQGKFELHIKAVNPAGVSSKEISLVVKSVFDGPVIELWHPQGDIAYSQPVIYGRARAQGEANLNLSSLGISLDGSAQTVTQAFIDDNDQAGEAYCIPSEPLSAGAHKAVFTACDTNGHCASKEWTFTAVDLFDPEGPDGLEPPAGGYVWAQVGTVVSREYKTRSYPPLCYWDVNSDNFAQKLTAVKDSGLAAAPEEYSDGNVQGVTIIWQGTLGTMSADANVQLNTCIISEQVAHIFEIEDDSIPVYTSVIFDCSHQDCCSSYVKRLTIEADDKFSLSLDKKLQQALFRRPVSNYRPHKISPVFPYYGPRVTLRYYFDPAEYGLSDNNSPDLWPRSFVVNDRTHFNLHAAVYGWRKQ